MADDLANGKNIIFCATGISDSALLRGVKSQGATAITHSILMRAKSRTVRFIRASHDLQTKTIRLRSDNREHLSFAEGRIRDGYPALFFRISR